jgi:dolichol-phosphate mannosyltransferase
MKEIIFSIVIPTYNEAKNVEILLPELRNIFKHWDMEVIFIDDGSNDGTREYIRGQMKVSPNIKMIERPKLMGIGSALIEGYNLAQGKYIISVDSDLSFPLEDVHKIAQSLLSDKYGMVLGSRYIAGSYYEAPNFEIFKKRAVSYFGNIFLRLTTGIKVHDFSANCRGISGKVWRELSLESNDNFMLFETVWRVHKKGLAIAEVPVRFFDRRFGSSKLKLGSVMSKFLSQYFKLVKSGQ